PDAGKCARLVQRSKIAQCLQCGAHGRGQPDGLAETSPAMNDPVADRVDRLVLIEEVLDRVGVVRTSPRIDGGRAHHKVAVVEHGELEGARTGVHDKDAHAGQSRPVSTTRSRTVPPADPRHTPWSTPGARLACPA